jgi:glycosyltransferase involved in cell wall biosynthesis
MEDLGRRPLPAMNAGLVAIVHDWLIDRGGAERLLECVLALFPGAPLYTLVSVAGEARRHLPGGHPIRTSFLQHGPFVREHYRLYLPLMPKAVEQFDLSGFDLVISLSHAVAHGARTRSGQTHVNYVHTPMRFAWHQADLHLGMTPWRAAARLMMGHLRAWDVAAAQRVSHLIANSHWTRANVWSAYHREAEVVYPPVAVERFRPAPSRDAFYVTVSRLVRHKRVDVILDAFRVLGLPLIVIGDGPERRRLAAMAPDNVRLMGWQPDEVVADVLGRARGFVYAAEEDFGIAPVEAMAAGCPVIAYGIGGVAESVEPGETGVLYERQEAGSLAEAVRTFERSGIDCRPEALHDRARRFGLERFQRQFAACLSAALKETGFAPSNPIWS